MMWTVYNVYVMAVVVVHQETASLALAVFECLLGDRLCWVYDLPVCLYGELSTHGLHLFYIVCSYCSSSPTHACCSHMLPSFPFCSCSGSTVVMDCTQVLLEILDI